MVRRGRSRQKKKGSGVAGFLLFLLLLIVAGAGAAEWFVFLPAGPSTEIFVEIAPGSGSRLIGGELERAGIIRSRYAFDAVRLWKHGSLKAGEYRFDHAAPVTEVY